LKIKPLALRHAEVAREPVGDVDGDGRWRR